MNHIIWYIIYVYTFVCLPKSWIWPRVSARDDLFDRDFEIVKSSIIDCDDITSGFFAYSEIRFGRPSDYSEECFRKWDSRNLFKSTNVTIFRNRHLVTCCESQHEVTNVSLYTRSCYKSVTSWLNTVTEWKESGNFKNTLNITVEWMP